MTDEILTDLLSGNADHVESLPSDYFEGVIQGQQPSVVSICCSDSRVSQEGMWDVDHPGEVFTPSNIGNQVWDADAGERIVDGGLLYPIHHCGTDAVAVVGHTGCGAVTAAYEVARGGDAPRPHGVSKWIELLVPVIREALGDDRVDADADGAPQGVDEVTLIDQLVEYNVDAQVEFLLDATEVPDDVAVYGFVYDFEGAYGDQRGRAYLVNYNGVTEPDRIRERVPAEYRAAVNSLLY